MKFSSLLSGVLFCTLLFTNQFISHAQNVSATVLEASTNDPVPFVTVQLGKNYGVITNSEGVFEINTARFTPTDSLVFSFMGYERLALALKDFKGEAVLLKEAVNTLGQVYLLDKKLNPLSILDSVRAHIPKNYASLPSKLSIFEREKSTDNPIDVEFEIKKADFIPRKQLKSFGSEFEQMSAASKNTTSNTYRDTYMQLYSGGKETDKLDIKKTTKLYNSSRNNSNEVIQKKVMELIIKKLETSSTFKVRSGIIPVADSISLKNLSSERVDTLSISEKRGSLNRKFARFGFGEASDFDFISDSKKYDFELTGAIDYNNEMVYVMSFTPSRKSAKYEGEMYVSANSYAVIKVEYKLAPGKTGNSINLKLLLGIKFKETAKAALVLYQQGPEGNYYPKFIKTTTSQYTYFDRSLTFVENAPRKDRIKLKMALLSEAIVHSENQLLILDSEPLSLSQFNQFKEQENVSIINIEQYNPALWKEYTIIAPDEAIKKFDY